ncbi:MAG: hypothetical protein ACLQGP_36175 [Isosphaeraceae bacterium]
MIRWPMRPVNRRSFALSLLIAPMACLGCGGDAVVTESGGKRRQKAEGLEKKAEEIRDSGKKKAP